MRDSINIDTSDKYCSNFKKENTEDLSEEQYHCYVFDLTTQFTLCTLLFWSFNFDTAKI